MKLSLVNRQNRFENEFRSFGSATNKLADSLGAHETAAICSRAALARAYAEYTWNNKYRWITIIAEMNVKQKECVIP